ncbi:MAG: tyrosine-type recombinase/integrase [Pseudomonadota bacterium]
MAKPGLLTDRFVESAKVADGREEFPDLKVQGLRLRVSGSGRKVWIVRARSGEKMVTKTLGRYPIMSLSKARTAALGELEAMAGGKGEGLNRTFDELVTAWIERHAKPKNKSWEKQKRQLDLHAIPKFGSRKVRDIKRAEVREFIDNLEGDVLPNRVLTSLKTLFRWALENDWIEASPIEGIRKPKLDKPRDRVLSMDEVVAIWNATERLGYPFFEYVRVLLLVAQRRTELSRAKWDWVDLENATLTLPASETKNKRAQLVPLSAPVVAMLKAMPRFGQAGYVFTTNGTTPISGFAKLKAKLDKFLPDLQPWVFHDFRRTAATEMVRLGVLEEVVGKVLNHTPQGVTAKIYALHRYEPEKRNALDRWAAEVFRAVEGRSHDKVVPIRPAS